MLTDNSISATHRGKRVTVVVSDIIMLRAADKYVEVIYRDDTATPSATRTLLVSEPLKLIINTLPGLVSVSRSEAIAKSRMGSLTRNPFDRSWQIGLLGVGYVKVSRRFVPVLREVYGVGVAH